MLTGFCTSFSVSQVVTCSSLTVATSCERGYHLLSTGPHRRRLASCVRNPASGSRDVLIPYLKCIPSAKDGSVDSDVVSDARPSSPFSAVEACLEFVGSGGNQYQTYCFFDGGGVYLTDDLGSSAGVGRGADRNCNTRCGDGFCGGTRGGGLFYSVYALAAAEEA